jgi:hypothetical protein
MTQWLKQSTAATIKMGPFLDSTDGDTEMTGLTISQADIRLTKNGGAFAQTNNAAGATHDENGFYGVPLDTTDTNTLGTLKVFIHEATALSVWQDFMVVPANVWDSFFGADKLQVHVDEMTAGIITATVIAADAIGASELAADAVTEIQSGLATAAALTAVDDLIDTEVAAIKTVVDAIQVKTDSLTFTTANRVDSQVFGMQAGTVTAAAIATDAIDADALAANAVDEIWDEVMEGTVTARQSQRLANSANAAKLSGAATTTVTIRDVADTKDRIVATVDADGNRSAITLDVS